MKILIVGGTGTIGKVVVSALTPNHEVITAGRSTADIAVDITSRDAIVSMYEAAGPLDAMVAITGSAKWASFEELTEEDFHVGLNDKLMGQVNLVHVGKDYLNPGGSFTLTTGILADDPVLKTSSPAMVNGAIHSFVQAVAMEMKNGQRINVVSAGLVEDSVTKYKDYFPGHNPIPMWKVANGYLKSILGGINGQIIRIYD